MKVVIDTNVLLSAALRDRDPEAVIRYVAVTPGVEWVVSDPIVAEYHDVLRRPRFGLAPDVIAEWLSLIGRVTTLITVVPEIAFPRDPKDAPFLACAVAARADFLITGDHDFENAGRIGPTIIISVSRFRRLIEESGPLPPAAKNGD